MNVLALDTATSVLSLALSSNDQLWYFEIDAGLKHSELLMEGVDMLLKKAGLKPEALERIACMKGPGSFTGLRIGFSAAKGLALSLDIPMVSVSTLDCMAHTHSVWPGPVLPVINARKNRYFTALYRGTERISAYMDAAPGEILELIYSASLKGPVLFTGPDADMIKPEPGEPALPEGFSVDPFHKNGKSRELLDIAKNIAILNNNEVLSGPLYLRKSDAELNLTETILKV
ncbi:MAG: tRNA (adenosine(37)-N6)-threonylcarbamoyltransferase complex dimerization subunit type 1 TsaB [Spirochaetaceae bacterium]|jgi:tRNA threonylcarbamoyladenosine biosynthesis protein TsaB|nr:tRNA (adenosine(37)-N6)-threonylcarbamoyltransferase complex dimerization subunit type 1 TsaB [Spirochaetaceae bacterium]